MNKKIYISGPITGIPPKQSHAAFDKQERNIIFRGDTPVNPLKICDPSWDWDRCMAACIDALASCNEVIMLPGWQNSRGACIEHDRAIEYGIKVSYYFRYSKEEKQAVLQMKSMGRTTEEIAESIGRSYSSVAIFLANNPQRKY